MTVLNQLIAWIDPKLHLGASVIISLLTTLLAFRSVEMEAETIRTFLFFYVILGIMILVFIFQEKFSSERTRQLIQFSFILLGSVLMLTGLLSVLGRSLSMAAIFFLILFLPGIAIFRAGMHFKKVDHES